MDSRSASGYVDLSDSNSIQTVLLPPVPYDEMSSFQGRVNLPGPVENNDIELTR